MMPSATEMNWGRGGGVLSPQEVEREAENVGWRYLTVCNPAITGSGVWGWGSVEMLSY